jgi:Flp pilus assembly protein CpaB
MENKNINIIVISSIVILVVIVLVGLLYINNKDIQNNFDIINNTQQIKEKKPMTNLALEKQDKSYCENINNTELKNNCLIEVNKLTYTQRAFTEKNISICNELEDNFSVNVCKNYYYKSLNITENKSLNSTE